MESREVLLKKLFELGGFQKLQDKLAKASGVAILTVDYDGTPISKHSCPNEFCSRIRSQGYFSDFCKRCDSRGGIEAARQKKPFVYMCHMGLVDFALPILLGDSYIGAVMAGQVRINEKASLERVTDKHNEIYLDDEMQSLYNRLPTMSYERITSLADVLFSLFNYAIEEAAGRLSIYSVNENEDVPRLLLPAMKLIQENYTKELRLDSLATACGISASYFSKIFKKYHKIGVANYIAQQRIAKAKTLLVTTGKTVAEICYEVGYDECGYFIKVFKKNVGTTPHKYREAFSVL